MSYSQQPSPSVPKGETKGKYTAVFESVFDPPIRYPGCFALFNQGAERVDAVQITEGLMQ